MNEYTLNESLFIARDANGTPLEQPSSEGEMVVLGYDYKLQQLVELHILTESENWAEDQVRGLMERLVLLAGVNDGTVPRVLDKGRMDGLLFFAVALEEGERLVDYAARVGGIPERATLELLQGVVRKLDQLQQFPRLFRACSLDMAQLIYSPQSTHSQRIIQIRNLGLSQTTTRSGGETAEHRLCCEIGQLTYQMLSGHPSPLRGGPGLNSIRLLERCPSLSDFVARAFDQSNRQFLTLPGALAALADAGLCVSDLGIGSMGLPPFEVAWLKQIFGTYHPEQLYPVQFESKGPPVEALESLSCQAMVDAREKRPVFLLPIPGVNVLPRPPFDPNPAELENLTEEMTNHLLFPHSTWLSDGFSFHVESERSGFNLRQYVATRGELHINDVVAVLQQVEAGIKQATALGLRIPSLQPSAIQCVFTDACRGEKLVHLASLPMALWPSHRIKVRIHSTLLSVTSPWPVGADMIRPVEGRIGDAFILLAIALLGGESKFDATQVPQQVASYLKQMAQSLRRKDLVPGPREFIENLVKRIVAETSPVAVDKEAPSPEQIPAKPTLQLAPEHTPDQDSPNLAELPALLPATSPAAIAAHFRTPDVSTIEPEPDLRLTVESGAESTPEAESSPFANIFKEVVAEPVSIPEDSSMHAEISPSSDAPTSEAVPKDIPQAEPEEPEAVADVQPFPVEAMITSDSPETTQQSQIESLPATLPAAKLESESVVDAPVADIPAPIEDALATTDLSDEGPEQVMDDSGLPTLNVDLSRLTTSDSLFSRRARTITIRNR